MVAQSFEESLPNFLDAKERQKEATFESLENTGVLQKLAAYSWRSSQKTKAISILGSVKYQLIKL